MFIARVNWQKQRAFTLLEIMLAVAILAGMSLAIYRFVQANLMALRVSSETTAADARYDALRDLLATQWQSLPSGAGALKRSRIATSSRQSMPSILNVDSACSSQTVQVALMTAARVRARAPA
jgi:prepilin-type N-terminal cleavage/methylation domain-containing protein